MFTALRRLRSRVSALLLLIGVPVLFAASFFADGGGEGGGEGGEGEGGSGGGKGEGGGGAPTFNPPRDQAEFDRMVSDRLHRERAKYADYEDLKTKAGKFDELDAANKSELERAQEAQRKAEEERDTAKAGSQTTLRRAAVLVAATKANAADPSDVYALLSDEAKNALTIGDDGQVNGAEEAVKTLLEAKPHLVGGTTKTQGSADGGARGADGPGQLTRDDLKTMSPEDIVKARREGRLNDVMTGS